MRSDKQKLAGGPPFVSLVLAIVVSLLLSFQESPQLSGSGIGNPGSHQRYVRQHKSLQAFPS